jgi:hypothetical protein
MIDAMASDAGAIVLGAVIGAGSALITQVIALIAEARRERNRVKREQERFDRELELRKDERFLDIKQDLYSRLSLMVGDLIGYTYYPIDSITFPQLKPAPFPDLKEMKRIQSNIEMIADKERSVEIDIAVIKLLVASDMTYKDGLPVEDKKREADTARAGWWIAQTGMHRDLSSDKEFFKRAKEVVLPPDPPPAHGLPWWRKAIRKIERG